MKIQINHQSQTKKLALKKETLRRLTASELRLAAGGVTQTVCGGCTDSGHRCV